MTARDRIVIMLVATAVILAAVWVEVVSPERSEAGKVAAQVGQAQAQLSAAEGQAAGALSARKQYASAYAAIVNLGKAVPTSQEVPSLIDQLTEASNEKDVDFQSITDSGSSTRPAGSAASTAAASTASSAGFSEIPFTFSFEGSYFDLEHLFSKLTSFATLDSAGNIEVSGRLLTIQSVSLSPGTGGGKALAGSVTATAYMLPGSQSAAAGASPAGPAGTTASPVASPAASSSGPSPAVIKVNP
jgi:Tfp pilus assembly protein PilO